MVWRMGNEDYPFNGCATSRSKAWQTKGGKMKLRPLKDRIVVKPISRIKSSIIDVIMSEKDNMGNIVAVGEQAKNHLHIGEFVRFGTMGKDEYLNYQEYFEDGERYLIMSWKDICFISEENHAA